MCACGFIGDADRFIRLMLFSFIYIFVYVCVLVCSGVVGFLGLVGIGVYGVWEGFMFGFGFVLVVCVLFV